MEENNLKSLKHIVIHTFTTRTDIPKRMESAFKDSTVRDSKIAIYGESITTYKRKKNKPIKE